MKKAIVLCAVIAALALGGWGFKKFNFNKKHNPGDIVDVFNGVAVYFNGGVNHVEGRNLAADGYNIGLKYQCVEFVKRYYYQKLNHKMPDTYGHAKSFFDKNTADGELNKSRGLAQYENPSKYKPQEEEIIVFGPSAFNKYGHVAIISEVKDNEIEIIQQNPGPFGKARVVLPLKQEGGLWKIAKSRVRGRLGLKK